jgi:hypothetical protein
MVYPEKFIEKAKNLYPEWGQLHELFEQGSLSTLTLLDEKRPTGTITVATILNTTTIEELHELANSEIAKVEFYIEVLVFVEEYRKNHNKQLRQSIREAYCKGERLA